MADSGSLRPEPDAQLQCFLGSYAHFRSFGLHCSLPISGHFGEYIAKAVAQQVLAITVGSSALQEPCMRPAASRTDIRDRRVAKCR
jgi:hypothetical protein